jgi:hypothetical protein
MTPCVIGQNGLKLKTYHARINATQTDDEERAKDVRIGTCA